MFSNGNSKRNSRDLASVVTGDDTENYALLAGDEGEGGGGRGGGRATVTSDHHHRLDAIELERIGSIRSGELSPG